MLRPLSPQRTATAKRWGRHVAGLGIALAASACAVHRGPGDVYDPQIWREVDSRRADFGPALPVARIVLLRGRDGPAGETSPTSHEATDLLVADDAAIRYRLSQESSGAEFCADVVEGGDRVELRDVTGDGVPEVIFRSCFWGASDFAAELHVVRLQADANGTVSFRDVRGPFLDMRWIRFRWLELDGRIIGLLAVPEEDGTPATACHSCPKLHRYDVYAWSESAQAFTRLAEIPSTGQLHREDVDFVAEDLPYIRSQMQAHPPSR